MTPFNTSGKDIASQVSQNLSSLPEYAMLTSLPSFLPRRSLVVSSLLCLIALGSSSGCFSSEDRENAGLADNNVLYGDPSIGTNTNLFELERARDALRAHDVRTAQGIYEDVLAAAPPEDNPNAAVGKALTDLMLLTDAPSVRAFLVDQLKAERPDFDTQKLVWGDDGMLHWFSSNVSWKRSSPSSVGVRSLMADRLPWEDGRLNSWDAFVAPLASTGNELVDQALLMNVALGSIENSLSVAIEHEGFASYYFPSEALHGKNSASLGLVLGKVELLLLRAALQTVRAGVEVLAAYDHPWTVAKLTSDAYWDAVARDPDHPEHDASLDSSYDYQAAYINRTFMRSMRDEAPLERARRAFTAGLSDIRDAAQLAAQVQPGRFTIEWELLDRANLWGAGDTVDSLVASIDRPTKIANLVPEVQADLGALFEPGTLLLPPEVEWVEVLTPDEPWDLTSQALDTLEGRLVQGDLGQVDWIVDGQANGFEIGPATEPWLGRFYDVYDIY